MVAAYWKGLLGESYGRALPEFNVLVGANELKVKQRFHAVALSVAATSCAAEPGARSGPPLAVAGTLTKPNGDTKELMPLIHLFASRASEARNSSLCVATCQYHREVV